jgi:WD40 repeat protein
VWDVEKGEAQSWITFRTPQYKYETERIAVAPDGKTVYSVGISGNPVLVWDVESALVSLTFDAPSVVQCLAVSPDSKVLAIGSNDKKVWLYEVPPPKKK